MEVLALARVERLDAQPMATQAAQNHLLLGEVNGTDNRTGAAARRDVSWRARHPATVMHPIENYTQAASFRALAGSLSGQCEWRRRCVRRWLAAHQIIPWHL